MLYGTRPSAWELVESAARPAASPLFSPRRGPILANWHIGIYNPGMNILVVDDSRIMRNIVKNSLTSSKRFAEVNFFDAGDGIEAQAILDKNQIELLLLDWNMPRLNGLDLVKKLRADTKYDRLPIIMVTSEAAKYNVIEAVKAGVNDYLIKPVNERNLMEKIDRVL